MHNIDEIGVLRGTSSEQSKAGVILHVSNVAVTFEL